MTYIIFMFMFGLILGLAAVASNPSPYFAALGLVGASGMGCGILAGHGSPFLSLVLFLIYLGGMLVVFAYSAALAAEPYPETWGDWRVLGMMVGYLTAAGLAGVVAGDWRFANIRGLLDESGEFFVFRGDMEGVAFLYGSGGWLLVLGAWILLLALFVVLELTRGLSRGALRAV